MRDDSMPQETSNGKLLGSTSRNAVEAGLAHSECASAIAEFNRDLPSFCRLLGIAPSLLNLPTPTLLMLICMRQQSIIDTLRTDFNEMSRLGAPAP